MSIENLTSLVGALGDAFGDFQAASNDSVDQLTARLDTLESGVSRARIGPGWHSGTDPDACRQFHAMATSLSPDAVDPGVNGYRDILVRT